MLFMTYWELNENMAVAQRLKIAERLMAKGLFPPEGVNILRWDISPDGWGILLVESDNQTAVNSMLDAWRVGGDGFFKFTKTAPAVPVQESISSTAELVKKIGTI